ncbi:hypothetical protein G6O69_01370 [Pseudenhygromyxa sp. WMMC2535]|uniref:hypothetical protein n=1 Tax=Pseudenhygromyxa sp. WMMC2535 TaxID=2712867 RepID=UPI001553148B|nr:hypothetical protein [Pseudenhygromyxa sp. WMMC2535]NVB36462.1 hypothetical protein [Pseudenhygromyxa sp. WMMC2535]
MLDELAHLPEKTRKELQEAVSFAGVALDDALEAALLIGPAVHADRSDRALNPELLLVVSGLEIAPMTALAEAMHPFARKGLRFRTVTTEELRDGLDVYALEIAEWKRHHIVLHGDDPLAALEPAASDLRHEIERSVRGVNRRVRNRVLQGMADHARDLDPVLVVAFEHLLVAARHAMHLAKVDVPPRERELLEAFSRWLGLESDPSASLFARLRAGDRGRRPLEDLAVLRELLDAACRRVDTLEV